MIVLTQDNFIEEVLNSDIPVLVDFWAAWCRPCHQLGSVLEKVSVDAKGYKIGKVNTDENQELTKKYNITALPTVIVFKNGGVVNRWVGLQKESFITSKMEEILTNE